IKVSPCLANDLQDDLLGAVLGGVIHAIAPLLCSAPISPANLSYTCTCSHGGSRFLSSAYVEYPSAAPAAYTVRTPRQRPAGRRLVHATGTCLGPLAARLAALLPARIRAAHDRQTPRGMPRLPASNH